MAKTVTATMSPTDWLRARAAEDGLFVSDVAKRAQINQGALSRALRNGGPSRAVLEVIAEAMGWEVPPHIMAIARPGRAAGPHRVAQRGAVPKPTRTAVPADHIAVWTTYPREDPWFFYNDHEVVETVSRPASLRSAQHITAIRMPNATMAPWRQPDEFVILALRRPVAPGNHALIRLIPRARPNDPEMSLIARIDRMPEGDKPPSMTIYSLKGGLPDMRFFSFASMLRILEWPEIAGLS